MNKPTLGKWVAKLTEVTCGERLVANTGGYSSNAEPTRPTNEANAQMIAEAANQCQAVNPEHPELVAGQIKAMYEALKQAIAYLEMHGHSRTGDFAIEVGRKALDQAEGKEVKQ